MALGEWGMDMREALALTETQTAYLLRGYMRRKQFEARVLISQLGEAMQPKRESTSLAALGMMGFGIRGA